MNSRALRVEIDLVVVVLWVMGWVGVAGAVGQDQVVPPEISYQEALSQLTMGNATSRVNAVKTLGHFPRKEVVEALIRLMEEGEGSMANQAVMVLRGMGEIAKPAIPRFIQVLEQTLVAEGIRQQIVWTLSEWGDVRAIPALITLTRSDQLGLRQAAVHALGAMKDPSTLPTLIQALRDPNKPLRGMAVVALGGLGTLAVPALLSVLQDGDPEVAGKAAEVLAQFDDVRIVPAMIEALAVDRQGGGWEIVKSLKTRSDALPQLMAAAKDSRAPVRLGVMRTMSYFRDAAVIRILEEALKDPDKMVRSAAVGALGVMGVDAVPGLIMAMGDPHPDIRRQAVGCLEPLAEKGLNGLLLGLGDADREVRRFSESALSNVQVNICKELMSMAKDPRIEVRAAVMRAFGQQGCREAADLALEALKDEAVAVRRQAVWALGQLGEPRAIPLLKMMIQDPDSETQRVVAEAMDRLGELEDPNFRRRPK